MTRRRRSRPDELKNPGFLDMDPLRDDPENRRSTPVQRLVSVRELDAWIKGAIRLEPTTADPTLFPELAAAQTPKPVPGAESVTGVPTLLEVTDTYEYWPAKGDKRAAPLTQDKWKLVDPRKRCDRTQRAVVVLGRRRGQIIDVCVASGTCKAHWAETIRETPKQRAATLSPAARAKAEKARKAQAAAVKKQQADQAARRERHALLEGVVAEGLKLLEKQPLSAFKADRVVTLLVTHQQHVNVRDLVVETLNDSWFDTPKAFERTAKAFALFGVNLSALLKARERAQTSAAKARVKEGR